MRDSIPRDETGFSFRFMQMRRLLFFFSIIGAFSRAEDCDKAPENYRVNARYSTQPVRGKYQSGTKVEFTCENRNRVVNGSCSARCLEGKWTPELGRCPYLCSLKRLEEKGEFLYVRVEGQTQNQNWFVHGTKGQAHCAYSGFDIWTTSKYRVWICVDGDWKKVSDEWHYN